MILVNAGSTASSDASPTSLVVIGSATKDEGYVRLHLSEGMADPALVPAPHCGSSEVGRDATPSPAAAPWSLIASPCVRVAASARARARLPRRRSVAGRRLPEVAAAAGGGLGELGGVGGASSCSASLVTAVKVTRVPPADSRPSPGRAASRWTRSPSDRPNSAAAMSSTA